MNDLSDLICPELFVRFRYCLKTQQEKKSVEFTFSDNAELADVFRYLEQHNYRYHTRNNTLTVTLNNGEE